MGESSTKEWFDERRCGTSYDTMVIIQWNLSPTVVEPMTLSYKK